MLTELCQELRNWFTDDSDKHIGDFTVSGGKLTPLVDLQEGQYYRIVGSVFNDGVHAYDDELTDELEFHGAVWCMKVPKEIVVLSKAIDDWLDKNSDILSSPYQSESFGGYSYTKASGSGSSGASGVTWQSQFASSLNRWRKI